MINPRLPDRQNPLLTSLILAFLSLLTETMIVGRLPTFVRLYGCGGLDTDNG
jgi:hypothetical protein